MSATEAASWRMANTRETSRGSERAAGTPHRPVLDEAAFERLHARTARPLWAYLRRAAGDPATADDVLQESYLRYLARPCPAAGERRETAYLFRIASNLLRDRWRRERRRRGWLEEVLARGPAAETESRLDGRLGRKLDVGTVLRELTPRQRALLWLAYVEGYDHREIAEILGLRAASIRVLLFRARRRLAALLRERGLEPETTDREVRR